MRYDILLACAFVTFIRADVITDDPPAIDEENFGKDMYCQFAIGGATDPKNFVGHDYIIYGQGHLLHHRLAFATINGLDAPQITITPDDCDDVWGVAYLVPVCQYKQIKKKVHRVDGVVVTHSVTKTIEVEVIGQKLEVKCNAFRTVTDPPPKGQETNQQKPKQEELDFFLECFRTAKLPPDYIEKVSKIPTRQC